MNIQLQNSDSNPVEIHQLTSPPEGFEAISRPFERHERRDCAAMVADQIHAGRRVSIGIERGNGNWRAIVYRHVDDKPPEIGRLNYWEQQADLSRPETNYQFGDCAGFIRNKS